MKPKSSIRKRFILAESDSLTIETIQTLEGTTQPDGATSLKGDTLRKRTSASPSRVSPGDIPGNTHRLRILKLKGTWRANKYNELCFEVTCRKGPPETYTFKGNWRINNNQQIEYTSEDGRDTLIFKGYWQIPSANKLVYMLEGSSTSRFEFKVQLESSTLYPKKGQIRYRIGIGISQNRLTAHSQLLILYGEWKFGRNLGLTFQMNYGQGKVRSIEFGAEVSFGRNKVIFALKDELGESLGIILTMTHKFLKNQDAQAFIRLKSLQSNKSEYGVEAGIALPF